ncbi:hypothetical protein, partial [Cryobacterium sp. Y29]|uniref:hypothetical protein n=1 Tax=Cryobacterium sp. Y29 TaxID=2048285 RepID=UPI001E5603B1
MGGQPVEEHLANVRLFLHILHILHILLVGPLRFVVQDLIRIVVGSDLPRAFRTAELVVSSTLPMLAVDNRSG